MRRQSTVAGSSARLDSDTAIGAMPSSVATILVMASGLPERSTSRGCVEPAMITPRSDDGRRRGDLRHEDRPLRVAAEHPSGRRCRREQRVADRHPPWRGGRATAHSATAVRTRSPDSHEPRPRAPTARSACGATRHPATQTRPTSRAPARGVKRNTSVRLDAHARVRCHRARREPWRVGPPHIDRHRQQHQAAGDHPHATHHGQHRRVVAALRIAVDLRRLVDLRDRGRLARRRRRPPR